ncbi:MULTISPECIES: cellulose biosynthesis regulator diguanylate cyclase DgcQ [Pantoea]|uniref:diguanylate cyclase n=1 Tax=Pantoea piersonii TaxID=2364647 RepID=A0AAJ5QKM1_9GAMM|nr:MULTISPECIES: cellulose biosynthesis regulator diguanylate cyclase DgcQ [Pantoea]MBZ6385455.1 cellulose biosynthesis regulator YedQ [Pantoea piersonii]MBZ6399001.1 cellulose biosynthesis regulator YedQ [Pantoea piersonii]MBZ6410386.1 cellulose biosynthesis regulator YedQ [Pantoea piersonii]MBZ6425548.1 cellulose biosynthesis regulator YedQ [Pantoea piersonii]NYB00928.1 cellulose biosynthesis regulator YedQ [Pantoea piersonii]
MAVLPLSVRTLRPELRVHLLFLAVFLFSFFLTLRELYTLHANYEDRQRAALVDMQNGLESQFQESIDGLIYYRRMFTYALSHPLDADHGRRALAEFHQLRRQPAWQLRLNMPRSMPINGVGDSGLAQDNLLQRDPARLDGELLAALEFSFIMQFSDAEADFHSRFWYTSRAGFFISSRPPQSLSAISASYATIVSRPWFRAISALASSQQLRWSGVYQGANDEGAMLTVSTPVFSDGYWYGVLSMDFTRQRIARLLNSMRHSALQGSVVLLDKAQQPLAALNASDGKALSDGARQRLYAQMARQPQGALRLESQFISWRRLKNVDGYLLNQQTLAQGLRQDLGRAMLFMLAMWLLFILLLLVTHQVIVRLVRRLSQLSARLEWRASYDGLTRLLNRSAFFERFEAETARCQQLNAPLSVIQLDIDHFKSVNDTWGHQAGDQALMRVAAIIAQALRKEDLAGRVGGEEFCVVLPDTGLADAQKVAERMRQRLAAKTILVNASRCFSVTLSAGVASSEEQGDYQATRLQAEADRRLYLAKSQGRNRVVADG